MVELRLLGPFEARRDGRPVALRPKQRALLAALALRPGAPVAVDRLVDDLWGEHPPTTATASLQNAVSLVRRTLGEGVVVTRPPGYALALEPERIDAARFERLVDEARRSPPAARVQLLRDALALWRGDALADLGDLAFADVEIARLEDQRATAREDLAEAELGVGRHAELVPEVEQLVAEEPFRERPRALLMLALYRAGRQADSLQAYRDTRRFLLDELGVEPSPALRTLQQAILRQDPALDPPDAAPLTRLPEEERRATVTAVFCDVVDSTALGATLDAEAHRNVLRRYYRTARDVLERHGGTVEKFVGDAVLGVFGVPERREDDALRAVRAASELHAAVAELNAELERGHGVSIRIRVGVNTGEVVVGEPDSGYSFATGYAVNVAAKLEQSAGAGETVLGAATLRLVRDAVRAEPRPPLELGAPAAAVAAYRLLEVRGRDGVARNLLAPLVGRERELGTLRDAWMQVRDGRRCRVVCLVGEAGIGKTRLARELSRAVAADATVIVGRCVSYGEGATYLPIAEVLRHVAPDASEAGLAAAMGSGPDARRVALRLRQLTGLEEGAPPPGEGFWAFRRLLEELARIRPVLLVLDDVHWAEPMLLDLVEHVEEQAADAPVLVLCLAREVRESWRERVLTELAPLSPDETGRLVANLADVPADVRERIVAGAEGNALFAEQLVAHALEAGRAALDAVPETVEALLASRLDRLPARERAVLERAAVVGREFWRGAVAALADRDVGDALAALAARGLVWPVTSQLAGEDAFRFHHVLIRDVAYGAITKERRSDLHRRAAEWLDDRGEGWDEIVGYHLEQAYRLRVAVQPRDDDARHLADAAAERLEVAGLRAWKRADAGAAANLLGRAEPLRAREDGRRAQLLCELAGATRTLGDVELALRHFEAAAEVAAAVDDVATELRARLELLNVQIGIGREGEPARLLDLANEAIPVLERHGDHRALGRAWVLVGDVHATEGRMRPWAEAAQRAKVHYERAGWPASTPTAKFAAALFHGPEPARRLVRRYDEMRTAAADAGDRYVLATVLAFRGAVLAQRNDFESGRRHLAEARRHYQELGQWFQIASVVDPLLGQLELLAGRHDVAEAILRRACNEVGGRYENAGLALLLAYLAEVVQSRGAYDESEQLCLLAASHATPGDLVQVRWRAVLAKTYASRGAVAPALDLAREAVALFGASDALNWRASTLADLGDVLLASGEPAAAAVELEAALRLFRRKGNLVAVRHTRSRLAELALV